MKLIVPAVALIKVERLKERWGTDEACERAALEYIRETPVTLWKYRELANALRDYLQLNGPYRGEIIIALKED